MRVSNEQAREVATATHAGIGKMMRDLAADLLDAAASATRQGQRGSR